MQGGKCLSHGARRRVCAFPGEGGCGKNAISGGMCKKHHDIMKDASGLLDSLNTCVVVGGGGGSLEGSVASIGNVGAGVNGQMVIVGQQQQQQQQYQQQYGDSTMETDMDTKPPALPALPQLPPPQTQQQTSYTTTVNASPIAVSSSSAPSARKKHKHPHHQRGLSIFDEMPTVDAIINSGANSTQQVMLPAVHESAQLVVGMGNGDIVSGGQAGGLEVVSSSAEAVAVMPPPPPPPPSTTAEQTPSPQVSYADGPASSAAVAAASSSSNSSKPGEPDYYSPTIAIFEQMIKASEVIENPNPNPSKGYAGLSPPKLTPRGRKTVSFQEDRAVANCGVSRKVSSNNIAGQQQQQDEVGLSKPYVQAEAAAAATAHPVKDTQGQTVVGRTVSHDEHVSPTNCHHHQYHPHPPTQHHQQHQHQYAPETPALGDPTPMAIVSAGSHAPEHHHQQHHQQPIMPKRNYEHLFIPRAI